MATRGIVEPGGQKYDWPFDVRPGTAIQFPGPVLGPFGPSINDSRPVTQGPKEVMLFVGLVVGAVAGMVVIAILSEPRD